MWMAENPPIRSYVKKTQATRNCMLSFFNFSFQFFIDGSKKMLTIQLYLFISFAFQFIDSGYVHNYNNIH